MRITVGILYIIITFCLGIGVTKTYGVDFQTYTNINCGISIQYPIDWESLQVDGVTLRSDYIAEQLVNFQPTKASGSIVKIELRDISNSTDKSFEGVTSADEDYIRTDVGKFETAERTQIGEYPALKIVYVEEIPGVSKTDWSKKMEVDIVAFNREYKLIYDAENAADYKKFISKFEEMLPTFKIYEPNFNGCNPSYNAVTPESTDNATDLSFYHNVKHNVNTKYPSEWSYEELGYSESFPQGLFTVIFSAPLEVVVSPDGGKSYWARFSVSIENLKPARTTLAEYKDRTVKNLRESGTDVKDIIITPTILAGNPAYRIEDMTWLFDHWEKEVSIYAINSSKLYEVSWSGEQESLDRFSSDLKGMIESVQFH
jgi:hypothetical protein